MTDAAWYSWLSGFLDAEGCFAIHSQGYPLYTIALRDDDLSVLETIQERVGGSIHRESLQSRRDRGEHCNDVAKLSIGARAAATRLRDGLLETTKSGTWCNWLAGFLDGEGCFYSAYSGAPHRIQVLLSVTQRLDSRSALEMLHRRHGGFLYFDADRRYAANRRAQVRWTVSNHTAVGVRDALNEGIGLQTKKAAEFEVWSKALDAKIAGATKEQMMEYKQKLSDMKKYTEAKP